MENMTCRGFLGVLLTLVSFTVASSQDSVNKPPDASTANSVEVHTPPSSSVEREIDAELALIEQALKRVDDLRRDFDIRGDEFAGSAEASREHAAELAVALRKAAAGTDQADRLYESVVADLQVARRQLGEALDTWRKPSAVPGYTPGLNFDTVDVARIRGQIDTARGSLATLKAAEIAAKASEKSLRWQAVELRGGQVRRLNDLRIESMKLLSPAKRNRVLGISRDGIGQLLREVDHVVLSARLYRETRIKQLREARTLTRDLFVIGTLSYAILRLALVIVAVLTVRARWRGWLDRLRRSLFRRARSVSLKRQTNSVLNLFRTLVPWVLFLLAIAAIRWALKPAFAITEFAVVYQIALIYGLYRLAIELFVALIVGVGRHYRLRIAPDRQAKLLTTVRWVMRIVTPVALLLLISSRILGRGYLFHLVVQISWLIAAATVVGIVVSWRHVAAKAFLEVQPKGRLAGMVRHSEGRWYGVLITPACFLWMAGRAVLAIARDFALGFEQTRRGLAFVFRHRIERQAEVRGYAEVDFSSLPGEVLEAFTEDAVAAGPLVVDRFPGFDEFGTAFNAWREQRTGGAFLLTGERGCGKTTWLRNIVTNELPTTFVSLEHRSANTAELATVLGNSLFTGTKKSWTLDELRTVLEEGPRRVVIVDLAQHLFLATIGGYKIFDAFADLIEHTCETVFWLCAMSGLAWQRLRAVSPTPIVFRHHQELGGWKEDWVRELIRTRVAVAGIRVNYGDLIVDRLEGVSAQARLIESEEGYSRLLWDYSDGNPRVALHFFLRSLVPESTGSVRVRLFRAPVLESLGELDEGTLFTLAAIVTHENVTLGEAAAVTGFQKSLCRIQLNRLTELGVLKVDDDRYRVTTYWHRAAIRLLRRRNLLMD